MSTLPPWLTPQPKDVTRPKAPPFGTPTLGSPALTGNRPTVSDTVPPQKPMLAPSPAVNPTAPQIPGAPPAFEHPEKERNIAAVKARKRAMLGDGMPPPPPQMPQAAPESLAQGPDMRERKRRMIEGGGY